MVNLTKIKILKDNYLGVNYYHTIGNAKEVSTYLLDGLKKSKIDPNQYNRDGKKGDLKNPPIELYEYQPFFLLQRKNGEYTLLDGFRRLLWYNAPDHEISIRVYKEEDLTPQQIMKLMVYLNHFKFYGGNGAYYDRGFSLAMMVIFGLNIPKYYETFDSYLTLSDTERKYWRENTESDGENLSVKTRLLNPMFIPDMKFIESLLGTNVMLNDIMGALIYKMREKYPNKEFNSEFFLGKIKENSIILDLQERFKKNGNGTGAKSQETINRLTPLYENIFIEMFGDKVEKKFAEILDNTKKELEVLKKDKTLIKLTGNQKCYLLENILERRLKEKKPTTFKCLVYPKEPSIYRWGGNDDEKQTSLPPGLLENTKIEMSLVGKRGGFGQQELSLTFKNSKGDKFGVGHNYGGYHSYGKKYTHVRADRGIPTVQYDIELFVDITKKELKEAEDKHFNRN